ncbi:MAG: hypothetical protein GYA24_10930 [Candidatus Lokiarchaeota archaeon]|nr:hypothetical protein [Candidatus Lokiarchaeota archaeon]
MARPSPVVVPRSEAAECQNTRLGTVCGAARTADALACRARVSSWHRHERGPATR